MLGISAIAIIAGVIELFRSEDTGIENDLNTAGYSTGKWSDDDDMHPTITPIFGPNR